MRYPNILTNKIITMRKHFLFLAMAFLALGVAFSSCTKEEPIIDDPIDTNSGNQGSDNPLVGVYDLEMVYDSITTSDGTWFDNEFFETMTGKHNPPQYGYLTIAEGQGGKLNVTATFVDQTTQAEKVWFSTTATEVDGVLTLDDCTSDYYYDNIEEYMRLTFHAFENTLPTIYFKGIYTINLGYDYSYLNSYYCTKRN